MNFTEINGVKVAPAVIALAQKNSEVRELLAEIQRTDFSGLPRVYRDLIGMAMTGYHITGNWLSHLPELATIEREANRATLQELGYSPDAADPFNSRRHDPCVYAYARLRAGLLEWSDVVRALDASRQHVTEILVRPQTASPDERRRLRRFLREATCNDTPEVQDAQVETKTQRLLCGMIRRVREQLDDIPLYRVHQAKLRHGQARRRAARKPAKP